MNRLGEATSPYLQQHRDNPVHWWEWGEEAFAEARRRDIPVLISVGYAACHWCHVMAHESFEDSTVADLLNDSVVAIKVDREERPDVDAVYMTATQAMTGQGGWPMTVFATPAGEPFFCGTYYPRQAFVRLVQAVATTWREQPDAVRQQGAEVVAAVARSQGGGFEPVAGSINARLLDDAAGSLYREHDPVYGGFGGAPKFPPHMVLLFLLRHYQRSGDERSLEIVRHTCEAMARGGIFDQLGGGFARYSVDERWLVPHFEKMLYDNALLLRVYTQLWRLTGDEFALRVARQTARFLIRDLFAGGFVSSLDADTEGVEGSTYVWTPAQLIAALGEADGRWAADLLGVTAQGTFEHGTSVLRLARDVDAWPDDDANAARWASVRQRLLTLRGQRPQPARDDKVVAAWNGLAITALAEFAALTQDNQAADHADLAGRHLAEVHLVDQRLRRVSRDGRVGAPAGVLDDYGCVAEAFCALHQLTGEGRWLELAGRLLDVAREHFDDGRGGFFDTADDAETLVARPADPTDNATPAGLSSMAAAMLTYSALVGDSSYRDAAQRALETVSALLARHARYAGYACAVAEALMSGPYEIAVSGDPDSALARLARRLAPPGAVLVAGAPDQPGVPLLEGRPAIGGAATAYVCRGFVCDRPVTGEAELAELLASH